MDKYYKVAIREGRNNDIFVYLGKFGSYQTCQTYVIRKQRKYVSC